MNEFQQLLQELSHNLQLPLTTSVDSCALLVSDTLMVQIEKSKDEKKLILGAHLGELAPGKYRESLLKMALKSNGNSYPNLGILGYSCSSNQLALFDSLDLSSLNGELLAQLFTIFVDKALVWQSAIRDNIYPETMQLPEEKQTFVTR